MAQIKVRNISRAQLARNWKQAEKLAGCYTLTLAPSSTPGEYIAASLEFPLVLVRGTKENIVDRALDAQAQAVALVLTEGGTPPVPKRERMKQTHAAALKGVALLGRNKGA